MDERKKDYLFLIIIILIIIFLIFFFFTRFGKIEDKYLKPTGNIDVFYIDVDGNCGCVNDGICENVDNENNNKEDNTNSNENKNDNVYPVWNEEKDKYVLDKVFVDDNYDKFINQQHLNIFNNAFYEYTNKIAPGVSNTYCFVVHNSSNIIIKYNVEMYEDTNYDINLKYRLKRNDNYVIGNEDKWVTADELKTSFSNLSSNNSDKYSLDWKWDYKSDNDEKDTYIGENMDELYKLNIRFYFEQAS